MPANEELQIYDLGTFDDVHFHGAFHPTVKTFTIVGSTETQAGIVSGHLSAFPGSQSILVSHGLWVYPADRGKGYSTAYDKAIKHYAAKAGASAIIASVKQTNGVQHQRLTKLEWERISNALWMWRVNSPE